MDDVAVDGETHAGPLRGDLERPAGELPDVGRVLYANEGLHDGVVQKASRRRLRLEDGGDGAVGLKTANNVLARLDDRALRRSHDRGNDVGGLLLVAIEVYGDEIRAEGAREPGTVPSDRGLAFAVVRGLNLRLPVGGNAGAGARCRGQSGQGEGSESHREPVRARAFPSPGCHQAAKRRVLGRMSRAFAAAAGLLLGAAMLLAPSRVTAQVPGPPQLSASESGATIEAVTIQVYGVTKPSVVRRYLALHEGSILEQAQLNRDFDNLKRLPDYRPRVTIEAGASAHSVKLHWIVMAKWLKPTDHPFYADTPLSAPIQGVGFIVTSQSLDSRGTNISAYTQLSRRANLVRVLFTVPTRVDPVSGRDRQLIVDGFGGKGVFRASQPLAINIYSWTSGFEAVYLARGGDGTQFEIGARQQHSSTAESSGIVAPSLYDTYYAPARNTVLEAGLSHPCLVSPTKWRPPYCSVQYRIEALDGIGAFASTSTYQEYIGDVGNYTSIGSSTLVLHASAARTGGVCRKVSSFARRCAAIQSRFAEPMQKA